MKNIFIVLVYMTFLVIPIFSIGQTHNISGTVLAFNRYPVNNVTVKAKKAKTEVKTDENGQFEIDVRNNDVIQIRESVFVEYNEKVKEETESLKINLIFENKGNNVEKATTAGFLKREDLEYGLKNLFRDNSLYGTFVDVFEVIKYALPETNIIIENGRKTVQFRGPKSIHGSNAALILVDGVIAEEISFINPIEIISITKLSPNTAALYGARAANGVISITTK